MGPVAGASYDDRSCVLSPEDGEVIWKGSGSGESTPVRIHALNCAALEVVRCWYRTRNDPTRHVRWYPTPAWLPAVRRPCPWLDNHYDGNRNSPPQSAASSAAMPPARHPSRIAEPKHRRRHRVRRTWARSVSGRSRYTGAVVWHFAISSAPRDELDSGTFVGEVGAAGADSESRSEARGPGSGEASSMLRARTGASTLCTLQPRPGGRA
jgi:hypothetical protein